MPTCWAGYRYELYHLYLPLHPTWVRSGMTKLLASVQNLPEAEIVFENGADIIDVGGRP
ncbi:hypothetical protein [Phyllobacterium ifriqiyense]|uniref:hypothetical protein n=1 Tax=Phyllobacterium ifriqiyense TaxID=314238 RepID=UPI0033976F5C